MCIYVSSSLLDTYVLYYDEDTSVPYHPRLVLYTTYIGIIHFIVLLVLLLLLLLLLLEYWIGILDIPLDRNRRLQYLCACFYLLVHDSISVAFVPGLTQ